MIERNSSRLIALAVATVVTASWASTSTVEQQQRNLESFDYVWTTIRDRHWDPAMGGIDWEALRDELRPEVERTPDIEHARAAMETMIDRLGLSHYAIIPAEIYDALGQPGGRGARDGSTGIDVRVVDGTALVTSVASAAPAAEAGVRPGWLIERIGEEEIGPGLAAIAEQFEDSRYLDLIQASAVLGRLVGPVGESVTVSFLDGEDRAVELELTRAEERGKKVQLGYLPPIHVWIDVDTVSDDVGYIAFNMFIDPARLMPVFNDAMSSFMSAAGIIIDLRGNPGGAPGMAMGMAGWLISEKNNRLGTMYTRDNELDVVILPRPKTYSGPVAVLVDGLSGSCSEILAGGLKDLGRARVFGTRTSGAALPSAIEKLPNGDGFQYAVGNYISQGGETLEGVGVIPDVSIAPSREARLQGKDEVIEAAVAWIHEHE